MDQAELQAAITDHKEWLVNPDKGKRLDLRGADLTGADLTGATLTGADLTDADLTDATLTGADLTDAVLRGAVLTGADLTGAVLGGADLRDAVLRGAVLTDAVLRGAVLRDADLRDAKLEPLAAARLTIVPESGSFSGHKKLRGGKLAVLEIPHDAARSNSTGRKCRASRAIVRSIVEADGTPATEGVSLHDAAFAYRVGEEVTPHEWCADRWQECAGGIHFYLTREEAKAHA
jgi:hypothetical protein